MAVEQQATVAETEAPPKQLPGTEVRATELATYEAHRAELVREAEERYVLINGTEIIGVYPTSGEAYEAGVRKFGPTPETC